VSTQLTPAPAGLDAPHASPAPPASPLPTTAIPTSITVGPLEVAVLRWPEEAALRRALGALHRPRLLLVDMGTTAPWSLDDAEDWLRWPPDPEELLLRARHLADRLADQEPAAPLELDEHGVLRRGERWVSISPAQLPVVRLLLEHADRVVRFEEVVRTYATAGGSEHPASVRTVLSRIDAKVRRLGLEVASVRRRGIVLRTTSWR
jgi:hypothetical protein